MRHCSIWFRSTSMPWRKSELMSWYSRSWAPYVSVEQRKRNAAREVAKLRKAGRAISPVQIVSRAITTTVWGKAWCAHLESYRDYESRLPRGRSYVRNGSVIDLQIAPRAVTALVSGSDIYRVTVTISAVPKTAWRAICTDCTGKIESLIELLQGRLSKGVMERLCRQEHGLFPRPSEIKFSCSCPDYAIMCKHVAAVLYGVAARLDTKPELLFRLRDVNEEELIAQVGTALPAPMTGTASGRILDDSNVAALFGIDMDTSAAGDAKASATRKTPRGSRTSATPPDTKSCASQAGAVSVVRQKPQAAPAKPAMKRTRISKAPNTGISAKPASRTTTPKAKGQAAPAQPAPDKPVKWWLKSKSTKPSSVGKPTKRKSR